MFWVGRWFHESPKVPPELVACLPPWEGADITLVGRTAKPLANLLQKVPGTVWMDVTWPDTDPESLWRLLTMAETVDEFDVRGAGATLLRRRRDGLLQFRAPAQLPQWHTWRAIWHHRPELREEIAWRVGARLYRAWRGSAGAGLEVVQGDGYREWTLRADQDLEDRWISTLKALPARKVHVRLAQSAHRPGLPGLEPYLVQRWTVHWHALPGTDEGHRIMPPILLPPTWRASWRRQGQAGAAFRLAWWMTYGRVKPVEHRLIVKPERMDARSLQVVRQWARAIPLEDAWWAPDPRPTAVDAWFSDLLQRGAVWRQAAAIPITANGEDGDDRGPLTVTRWPQAGFSTWIAAWEQWPDAALLVYQPARGPYGSHLTARWTLTGPRLDLPLREPGFREALREVRRHRAHLIDWWSALDQAARLAESHIYPGSSTVPEPQPVR